ncbi:MAG: isoprenoid biosynthesis glyoxalase ElbB [Bacteroidales bacterium]|nr:isoprenoid biosynthesis glyoxalase ElbB [Bacteroidales bacterium]
MKKIAVVLAGCGVLDGAEIHEATMSLYAIKKLGAEYEIFAPDMDQYHVINHLTGKEMDEKRNVLVEAARIARGHIKPLSKYDVKDFDGLLFPGGFGAAKNLCTFAFDGYACKINPEVHEAIKTTHEAGKPIAALCVSPVLLAKALGKGKLTVGEQSGTSQAIERLGAKHEATHHGQVIVDQENKLLSTPCYMLNANIVQIAEGAENIVKEMLKMI